MSLLCLTQSLSWGGPGAGAGLIARGAHHSKAWWLVYLTLRLGPIKGRAPTTSPCGLASKDMEALGPVDFLPGSSVPPKASVTVTKVRLHHLLSPALRNHSGQFHHTRLIRAVTGPSSQWESGKCSSKTRWDRSCCCGRLWKIQPAVAHACIAQHDMQGPPGPTLSVSATEAQALPVTLTTYLLCLALHIAQSQPSFSRGGRMSDPLP